MDNTLLYAVKEVWILNIPFIHFKLWIIKKQKKRNIPSKKQKRNIKNSIRFNSVLNSVSGRGMVFINDALL